MPKLSEARKHARPRKTRRLAARVTDDQHDFFQRAADLQGCSLSDFIVSTLQKEAVHTIETMEMIRLNVKDSLELAEALVAHPNAPSEYQLAIKRRYLETIHR
jgi:uncharacterized protein (DUF1778 family)